MTAVNGASELGFRRPWEREFGGGSWAGGRVSWRAAIRELSDASTRAATRELLQAARPTALRMEAAVQLLPGARGTWREWHQLLTMHVVPGRYGPAP